MISHLHAQMLMLSEIVSGLIAYKLTPDALRKILTNFAKQLETELPPDARKAVEAATAKAILRAVAYRRDD